MTGREREWLREQISVIQLAKLKAEPGRCRWCYEELPIDNHSKLRMFCGRSCQNRAEQFPEMVER